MPKTIRDSISKITKPQGVLDVATITDVNVLARDTNGVVLSVAPSVTGNIHGIGGLQRIELSAGINPLKLNVGDQLHVTQVQGRYMAVATMPISNRTKGGGESYGTGEGADYIAKPQMLHGTIAGSSLELTWQPVQDASYYEIWASGSADPSSPDAIVVGRTPTTSWTSKGSGVYFDDSMYYTVVPHVETGTLGLAGAPADWIQPTFTGNYASGMTSKNQTTNIPGSLTVTKAGSILRADATSLDSPQTFNLDVCDPMGTHPTTAPFSVNDILRMVDVSGNELWVKVNSASDQTTFWRYNVTKQSPSAGTNRTIKSGAAVADWGASGQGVFAVSADGTFGAGTLWEIVTHTGSPWSSLTKQVYADSTGKLNAGAGAVTLDVNGIAIAYGASTPNLLRWTNGSDTVAYLSASAATYYGLSINANGYFQNGVGSLTLNAFNDAAVSSTLYLTSNGSQEYAAFYMSGAGTYKGVVISNVTSTFPVPSSLLELYSTAPTFRMTDTTSSAKSLLLTTDANLSTFSEVGGAAPNLLVLDLANARVGVGVAPTETFEINTANNNQGARVVFTGSSSSSVTAQLTLGTNDAAAMASSDRIGQIVFSGYNGASFVGAPLVLGRTTELWSGTARGSKLEFYTVQNTTTGQTLALTLEQDQSATFAGIIHGLVAATAASDAARLDQIKSSVFGNLLASTIALGTTTFFGPGTTVTGATEANEAMPIGYAGTARNFYMTTSTAQPATGSLVFTVRKNAGNTTSTITIAAGAAAGVFSDTTHTFTFAAGDTLDVQVLNNALGVSAALQGWSLEVDRI